MSPFDFWACELWEVLWGLEGFNDIETRRLKELYTMIRLNAFFNILPHSKKGRLKSPKDLIKFEWEKADEKPTTKADIMQLFERIKARDGVN